MSRVRTPLHRQKINDMKKKLKRIVIAWVILLFALALVSCNPKACPAYAKNNTEQQKNV
jgi:hypothetical protein